MRIFFIGLTLALCIGTGQADERLWVEASINGRPARFMFDTDGALGWGPLSDNIVSIDACALRLVFLEAVPEDAIAWTRLQVQTNSGYLFLRIPHSDGSQGKILVDTGFVGGVALHPRRWRKWIAVHTNQPTTLDSYFMPGAGLVVKREVWAQQLDFGPLR